MDAKVLKRKTIIETAAKEFALKGFENANINEIAIMSGIGKGSIYLYFKTKKDLYLATMETVVEYFNEASSQIMNQDITVLAKLKLCIESLFLFEKESYPFLILWSRYQFQNNPDFREEVFGIFENLQQPLCLIVKEGVDQGIFATPYPEASGYLILSMISMLLPSLQPKSLLEEVSIDDKVNYIMEFVEKGIRKT